MSTINILQVVVGGKLFTGVVSFLYQYYTHIDHEKVHFDFCFIRENALGSKADDPVFSDSKFYVLNAIKSNNKTDHKKMVEGLEEILSRNCYDVVHINTLSVGANVPLIATCKKHHIPTIISHSHNEFEKGISSIKRLAHIVFQPYIVKNADLLFACSTNAGVCLFGEKGVHSSKFHLIKNAVDPSLFSYSEDKRNEIRNSMEVSHDRIIVGQIGRLSEQKNQSFSVKVYNEFQKLNPDSEFWIVGAGSNEVKLKQQVRELALDSHVRFLGQRSDVNDLLSAMDVLLFPSLWEGLSIAAVEGQATGIPILFSRNVTSETAVTDSVAFMGLDESPAVWAEKLKELYNPAGRRNHHDELRKSGFAIAEAAKSLEDIYLGRQDI